MRIFSEIKNAKNFLNNSVNKGQKWLQGCKWNRWLCKCRKTGGKVAGFRRRNKGKKQFADRRYGADARGRAAGLKATVARRSRVQRKHAWSRSRVSG